MLTSCWNWPVLVDGSQMLAVCGSPMYMPYVVAREGRRRYTQTGWQCMATAITLTRLLSLTHIHPLSSPHPSFSHSPQTLLVHTAPWSSSQSAHVAHWRVEHRPRPSALCPFCTCLFPSASLLPSLDLAHGHLTLRQPYASSPTTPLSKTSMLTIRIKSLPAVLH